MTNHGDQGPEADPCRKGNTGDGCSPLHATAPSHTSGVRRCHHHLPSMDAPHLIPPRRIQPQGCAQLAQELGLSLQEEGWPRNGLGKAQDRVVCSGKCPHGQGRVTPQSQQPRRWKREMILAGRGALTSCEVNSRRASMGRSQHKD